MAILQNAINANSISPLPALDGGSGVSNPTAHGILVAEGASAYTPIVLAAGQVLIGTTASDPAAAALTAGAGVSIVSASGSVTISAAPAVVDQTAASVTMASNTTYFADNAGLVTLTLPTGAAFGDTIAVYGKGAGGWKIAQAASQQIFFGNTSSTAGVAGSLASTLQYDCVRLYALTAGATSTWVVVSSVGNLTVT